MANGRPAWTDEMVEHVLGNLLRAGVLAAAVVVLAGGCLYLHGHAGELADNQEFHGEEARFCSPPAIVRAAGTFSGRGIIQLGLLLLIATPVARVVFSVFAFARQRDFAYVGITLIVLIVLLSSLFSTHLGGP